METNNNNETRNAALDKLLLAGRIWRRLDEAYSLIEADCEGVGVDTQEGCDDRHKVFRDTLQYVDWAKRSLRYYIEDNAFGEVLALVEADEEEVHS